MGELYKNKYRISTVRRRGWDYATHGLYFVTICTKDRVRYFGEIVETRNETQSIVSLQETVLGKVAFENWTKISEYHPYVEIDEFVIMPDHIHGILFINKPERDDWQQNKFGPQSKNLASIIRGYKASVKQYATINNLEFQWQPKYYDRVIRNHQEFLNIKEYIYNNVENWILDKDNLENILFP